MGADSALAGVAEPQCLELHSDGTAARARDASGRSRRDGSGHREEGTRSASAKAR